MQADERTAPVGSDSLLMEGVPAVAEGIEELRGWIGNVKGCGEYLPKRLVH